MKLMMRITGAMGLVLVDGVDDAASAAAAPARRHLTRVGRVGSTFFGRPRWGRKLFAANVKFMKKIKVEKWLTGRARVEGEAEVEGSGRMRVGESGRRHSVVAWRVLCQAAGCVSSAPHECQMPQAVSNVEDERAVGCEE